LSAKRGDQTVAQVAQHAPVLGTHAAAVGADVVVDVAVNHSPLASLRELLAVGELATNAESVSLAI
jgi:hypothetical protein